jgi:tRNA nucleotidyltransferase (CCA-adding enzyme)
VVEAVPPRLKLRLAALLHDVGKPCTFTVDENGVGHFYGHHTEGSRITRDILRRLRYDNQTIQDVSLLVAAHMSRFAGLRDASLIRLVKTVGEHNLDDLYDLQKADTLGSAPPFDFTALNDLQKGIARILEEKPPMHVRDLAVDGYDLMELGFAPSGHWTDY